MELEFGSWALVKAPSLLALVPLIIYIVMAFRGKNNVSGLLVGIAVASLLLGLDVKQLAGDVGLPMSVFATAILAATRLTGSMYPTTNFAGQMGTARSENTKDGLRALWISVAFVWVWIIVWGLIGTRFLG